MADLKTAFLGSDERRGIIPLLADLSELTGNGKHYFNKDAEGKILFGGVFTKEDEAAWNALLLAIREDPTRGEKDADILVAFYSWMLPVDSHGLTWFFQKGARTLAGNAFRKFIITLGSKGGEVTFKEVTTGTNQTPSSETKTEKTWIEVNRSGTSYKFVCWMIDTIKDKRPRQKGYEHLLTKLKTREVPVGVRITEDDLSWISHFYALLWIQFGSGYVYGKALNVTEPEAVATFQKEVEGRFDRITPSNKAMLAIVVLCLAAVIAATLFL